MAARFDLLIGRQHPSRMVVAGTETPAMTFDERVARIQRKRRIGAATAALETVLWLSATAVVAAIAVVGITGLH